MGNTLWLTTAQVCKRLSVSRWYLSRRMKDPFVEGVHYRNISPTAWRPTYRWNLLAIEALLDEEVRHGR